MDKNEFDRLENEFWLELQKRWPYFSFLRRQSIMWEDLPNTDKDLIMALQRHIAKDTLLSVKESLLERTAYKEDVRKFEYIGYEFKIIWRAGKGEFEFRKPNISSIPFFLDPEGFLDSTRKHFEINLEEFEVKAVFGAKNVGELLIEFIDQEANELIKKWEKESDGFLQEAELAFRDALDAVCSPVANKRYNNV